jgi:hypothetical protein
MMKYEHLRGFGLVVFDLALSLKDGGVVVVLECWKGAREWTCYLQYLLLEVIDHEGGFYFRDDPEDHSLLVLTTPFLPRQARILYADIRLCHHSVVAADTNLVSIRTPPLACQPSDCSCSIPGPTLAGRAGHDGLARPLETES